MNKLITYQWTPKGRIPMKWSQEDFMKELIEHLRAMVRETSYNVVQLESQNAPNDETWSRAVSLRQQAVDTLRTFDPNADKFIEATYQPKAFLHA